MTYVGIDACSKGWIAVAMAANGIAQAHFLSTIAMVASVVPDARVIAIDIPIGFPTTGHREADLSARAVLGARRSSLFLKVSFTRLIGAPANHSKKTWAGMVERREALDQAGIVLDHLTPDAARFAAVDDMFDAAVLAWTARRIHDGAAESFPATPKVGTDGRVIAIWA